MANVALTNVLEEIKSLRPDELREVERAARHLLHPHDLEAEREAVLRILQESGLVKDIKRPPMDVDIDRALVPIQGKLISETIIEDRR